MALKFNVVSKEGDIESVTVFIQGGEPLVATRDHKNFTGILDALRSGTDDAEHVKGLFDVGFAVGMKFERLSERVMVSNGVVYFDGEAQYNALATAIIKFHIDGLDFAPLVNFMEKIAGNPNEHSRENLFRWLSKHEFGLTPDGDFVAYKGVTDQGGSINHGKAIVNGVWMDGSIPNKPGTVIEMPRGDVQFNPAVGCSTGLHAGNWRYANWWASNRGGGKVLRVRINPRDVVSVPTDSNDEKLRTCRYKVIDMVTQPDTSVLVITPDKTAPRPDNSGAVLLKDKAKPKKGAAKPAAKKAGGSTKKAAKPRKLPAHYEQYTREDFEQVDYNTLRWLAKHWRDQGDAVTLFGSGKAALVAALAKTAKARLKTWPADER